jgi:myo-inositol-1(or 4)-monophosphatase
MIGAVKGKDVLRFRDIAATAAHRAGDLLTAYFRRVELADIERKSTAIDLVSLADREAEELLRSQLPGDSEGIGFIGEESSSGRTTATHDLSWIVDPLDGTSNYLAGLPIWAVSIALCDLTGTQPVALAGVVHAPLLSRTWTTAVGHGAHLNGAPIRVRSEPPGGGLQNAMLATGFPYNLAEDDSGTNLSNFCRMQQRFHKVRRLGAAAVDLAFVADGTFDGMWELSLQLWDVAAGMLLIREAGGHFEWRFPRQDNWAVSILAASRSDLLDSMRTLVQFDSV